MPEAPQPSAVYRLPTGVPLRDLIRAIEAHVPARAHSPDRSERVYYDTFDHRLWFAGLDFFVSGACAILQSHGLTAPGPRLGTLDLTDTALPRLAGDLPAGPVGRRLGELLGVRALMPDCAVGLREQLLEAENEDGKVVTRVLLQSLHRPGKPNAVFERRCLLCPLRGYEKNAEQINEIFRAIGAEETDRGVRAACHAAYGTEPMPYSVKPDLEISPEEPVRRVASRIALSALRVARLNEAGVIDDIDTEFLHDYRISLRRIRSALSLLRGAFPETDAKRLKAEFRDIQARTNRLRDLDVWLLARPSFEKDVPPVLRRGLDTMFADFAKQRDAEAARVRRFLMSKAYRKRMDKLETFFETTRELPASANSATRVDQFAVQRIRRRFRRIRRQTQALEPAAPTEALHKLRIECKKLRYLLEFFSQLLTPQPAERLIRRLRRLQNRLGTFNDLDVQQAAVLDYANGQTDTDGRGDAALLMTLGGLLAEAGRRKQQQEAKIRRRLRSFCRTDIRELSRPAPNE